jgi:hypothetical protein
MEIFSLLLLFIISFMIKLPRGCLTCGLTGFTGAQAVDATKLRVLLCQNESRGKDSTGIFGNQRSRAVLPASEFVNHQMFLNSITGAKQVIAHTRKATSGDVVKQHAHPFRIGEGRESLVGAHNGSLSKLAFDKSVEKFKLSPVPEVDSQLIFQVLHNNRLKNGALDFNILEDVDGSMALTIIYQDLLYIYKRNTRPLHWGVTKEGIYYSSEASPLRLVGAKDVREFESHVLHIFKDGQLIGKNQIKEPRFSGVFAGGNRSYGAGDICDYTYNSRQSNRSAAFRNSEEPQSTRSSNNSATASAQQPQLALKCGTSIEHDEAKTKFWSEIAENLISSTEEYKLEHALASKQHFQHFNNDETYVFVSLKASNKSKALKALASWYIAINKVGSPKNEDRMSITGDDGFAAFKLDENFFTTKDSVEINFTALNPISENNHFYTYSFNVERGRVLEVTLHIPFRSLKLSEDEQRSYESLAELLRKTGTTESPTFVENSLGTPLSIHDHSCELGDLDGKIRAIEAKIHAEDIQETPPEREAEIVRECELENVTKKDLEETVVGKSEEEAYVDDFFNVELAKVHEEHNSLGAAINSHLWGYDGTTTIEEWDSKMTSLPVREKRTKLLQLLKEWYGDSRFDLSKLLHLSVVFSKISDPRNDDLVDVSSQLISNNLISQEKILKKETAHPATIGLLKGDLEDSKSTNANISSEVSSIETLISRLKENHRFLASLMGNSIPGDTQKRQLKNIYSAVDYLELLRNDLLIYYDYTNRE